MATVVSYHLDWLFGWLYNKPYGSRAIFEFQFVYWFICMYNRSVHLTRLVSVPAGTRFWDWVPGLDSETALWEWIPWTLESGWEPGTYFSNQDRDCLYSSFVGRKRACYIILPDIWKIPDIRAHQRIYIIPAGICSIYQLNSLKLYICETGTCYKKKLASIFNHSGINWWQPVSISIIMEQQQITYSS